MIAIAIYEAKLLYSPVDLSNHSYKVITSNLLRYTHLSFVFTLELRFIAIILSPNMGISLVENKHL